MKLFVAYFLATAVNCALSVPVEPTYVPCVDLNTPSPVDIASIPTVQSGIIFNGNVTINISDNRQSSCNQQNNNNNKPVTYFRPKLPAGYVNTSETNDYITAVKIHPTEQTWNDARKVCFYEGGFLAYATSKEEEDLYLKMMGDKKIQNLWIGIHNLFSDNSFLSTILGEVAKDVAYYTWWPGEKGADTCAHYKSNCENKGLRGSPCDTKYAFICKLKLINEYTTIPL